jgi:hypothetical protein
MGALWTFFWHLKKFFVAQEERHFFVCFSPFSFGVKVCLLFNCMDPFPLTRRKADYFLKARISG